MKQSRVICITGGIGSGKSTVCAMLESKGHPVYYSDERAKALMQTNATLVQGITALLGEKAFLQGELNRVYVAEKIFGNIEFKEKLEVLKEDRKDDRVKKQAVEQSKLISQRKGSRGEIQESPIGLGITNQLMQ